jgi:hypothetical protein
LRNLEFGLIRHSLNNDSERLYFNHIYITLFFVIFPEKQTELKNIVFLHKLIKLRIVCCFIYVQQGVGFNCDCISYNYFILRCACLLLVNVYIDIFIFMLFCRHWNYFFFYNFTVTFRSSRTILEFRWYKRVYRACISFGIDRKRYIH